MLFFRAKKLFKIIVNQENVYQRVLLRWFPRHGTPKKSLLRITCINCTSERVYSGREYVMKEVNK